MIQRRSLLGLSLALLPAVAFAQTSATPAQPRRRKLADKTFGEMTARQQRRVEQRLAGTGHQPLSAEDAKRRWDGMNTAQRRTAMRNPSRRHHKRQQPAQQPATQQPPA